MVKRHYRLFRWPEGKGSLGYSCLNQMSTSHLTVSFRHDLEAELAFLYLTLAAEPQEPRVQREITVSGIDLNM